MANRLRGIFLASALAFSIGLPASSLGQEKDIKEEIYKLYSEVGGRIFHVTDEDLEKELGKWDQRAVGLAQNIKFKLMPLLGSAGGSYHPKSNTLWIPSDELLFTLPRLNNGELSLDGLSEGELIVTRNDLVEFKANVGKFDKFVIDSFDHEYFHALEDLFEEMPDNTSMPTKREKREYVLSLLKSERLGSIVKEIGNIYLKNTNFYESVKGSYGGIEGFLEEDFTPYPEKIREGSKKLQEIKNRGLESKLLWKENDNFKPTINDWNESEPERRIMERILEVVEPYDNFADLEANELTYMLDMPEMESIWAFKDMPWIRLNRTIREETVQYELTYDPATEELHKGGVKKEDIPAVIKYYLDSRFQEWIVEEVLARGANGLMNVYFGPPGIRQWRQEYEDYMFWQKWKIDGTPIFGKPIVKGMVGHDLHSKGWNAENIQKYLEYAGTFTDGDGEMYRWRKSKADIEFVNARKGH